MGKLKDLKYAISTPLSEATMKKVPGGGPSENRIEAAADELSWLANKSLGYAQEVALE